MSVLRVVLVVCCLVYLIVIVRLVAAKKLSLRYSLLWLFLFLVVFVCALFPVIPYKLASVFGFVTPANFILVVAVLFLFAIILSLSVVVSRQQTQIKELVQLLAIEKHARHAGDESFNRHRS